jgi:hypothetical protein
MLLSCTAVRSAFYISLVDQMIIHRIFFCKSTSSIRFLCLHVQ